MSRTRTLAELAIARNRWFTPHTWTNGIGLLANLAVSAGVGGGPFLEFPYDPPGWTPERRDFMLAEPIRPDADGRLHVPTSPGPRHHPGRRRHQAVRGMTAQPRATAEDWLARAAAVDPRHELFIDGRFVPAASGETFEDIAGRDGQAIANVAERRPGGRRPGGRRSAAILRRSALVGSGTGDSQEGPAQARRPGPRPPGGTGPARVAGRRQADPRHAERGRAELRDHAAVVRRDHRQDVRRGRPDRPGRAVDGDARADRRRRGDRAVELPAHHHGVEAGGRPGDRAIPWC